MMDLVRDSGREASPENGTFSNLGTLPRVPLPDLASSAERFIEWCSPLLTRDELRQTKQTLNDFTKSGGDAEKLHAALVAYDQREDTYSWLDDFWPARYLGRRVPVAINANFVFSFVPRAQRQIERAAHLVGGAVRYKQLLDQEALPPSYLRDTPLCMVQNKYLFSTTRIPAAGRDIARTPYSEEAPGASKARHIIVAHRQILYRLDVIDANNQAYDLTALEQALQAIRDGAPDSADENTAIGYLSTLSRPHWARVREELINHDTDNGKQLDVIEQALFCLCLDDAEPGDLRETADQLLCGDGGNRWFDKSVSLIVFANGEAGINCEHCGLDGTTVVEFVDFLHNEATDQALQHQRGTRHGKSDVTVPAAQTLTFSLSNNLEHHIYVARSGFTALSKNTATLHFSFDDFGASHIKSLKLSPDAFAQLGFQLAHYRTKGLIGATYESIATRQYERGRTEAMRVVTPGIVDFVAAMENPDADTATKQAALYEAARQHIGRIKQCQAGEAPEQHLWQLHMLAQQQGKELNTALDAPFFHSPGWLKLRNDYLSTSSAPSENVTVFGFGATSEQCIGTAYLLRKDSLKAYLSTPTPVADNMQRFAENLPTAFRDMAKVLEQTA